MAALPASTRISTLQDMAFRTVAIAFGAPYLFEEIDVSKVIIPSPGKEAEPSKVTLTNDAEYEELGEYLATRYPNLTHLHVQNINVNRYGKLPTPAAKFVIWDRKRMGNELLAEDSIDTRYGFFFVSFSFGLGGGHAILCNRYRAQTNRNCRPVRQEKRIDSTSDKTN
jgi:hypothetical protein